MFLKVIAAIVGFIVIFCIVVATRPNDFHFERSIAINAPAEAIFPHLNNLKKSNEWSPFSKIDPNIKISYEGPEEGVGAKSSWEGNSDAGQGTMEIVESVPNERVKTSLHFVKPMEANNTAEYLLKTEGNQTTLTWSMSGQKNFISKAICMIMSMDKMLGPSFEQGLKNLKATAEASK